MQGLDEKNRNKITFSGIILRRKSHFRYKIATKVWNMQVF